MKKEYIKPEVTNRETLEVNEAIASCTVTNNIGDLFQYWPQRNPDGWTAEQIQYLVDLYTNHQGDQPHPQANVYCYAYHIHIEGIQITGSDVPDTFDILFEDWDGNGHLNADDIGPDGKIGIQSESSNLVELIIDKMTGEGISPSAIIS